MSKKIKLERHFAKTLTEKILLEILDDDIKKIESNGISLDEFIDDYAYNYKCEIIDVTSSDVIDNEINHIK
ncbi:MAG: hypothetical protein M0R46_15215 [Candidatus Muirbacterium halophilum]|nr:hypothetical protein [Candidatus Muirbacterium halophilum]